jgi:hypothetical protein
MALPFSLPCQMNELVDVLEDDKRDYEDESVWVAGEGALADSRMLEAARCGGRCCASNVMQPRPYCISCSLCRSSERSQPAACMPSVVLQAGYSDYWQQHPRIASSTEYARSVPPAHAPVGAPQRDPDGSLAQEEEALREGRQLSATRQMEST